MVLRIHQTRRILSCRAAFSILIQAGWHACQTAGGTSHSRSGMPASFLMQTVQSGLPILLEQLRVHWSIMLSWAKLDDGTHQQPRGMIICPLLDALAQGDIGHQQDGRDQGLAGTGAPCAAMR